MFTKRPGTRFWHTPRQCQIICYVKLVTCKTKSMLRQPNDVEYDVEAGCFRSPCLFWHVQDALSHIIQPQVWTSFYPNFTLVFMIFSPLSIWSYFVLQVVTFKPHVNIIPPYTLLFDLILFKHHVLCLSKLSRLETKQPQPSDNLSGLKWKCGGVSRPFLPIFWLVWVLPQGRIKLYSRIHGDHVNDSLKNFLRPLNASQPHEDGPLTASVQLEARKRRAIS